MAEKNMSLLSWNVCRCCGVDKNVGGVNLCGTDTVRVSRLSEIISLLPREVIHLDVADELPKFICADCEITLNHFSEFCEMVKKAQKSLKLQYASMKTGADNTIYVDEKAGDILCHTLGPSRNKSQITIVIGGDGKIKCQDCGYLLSYMELYALHLPAYKLTTVICVCEVCRHHGDIVSFFQNKNNSVCCPNCYFVSYKQPEENTQNRKQTKKVYECNICSKTFRCKSHCDRHKMIHTGAKPFLCETCGNGFNQKKSLKLHMLSHSGINPHDCKWCGQSFRFKVSLESHVINMHSSMIEKEQKIECDRCKKQFATKYKLFRHHRSHTGLRPYKCQICNKFFSQTGNLKAHLKKHKIDDTFSKTLDSHELTENSSLKSLGTIFEEHCPPRKEFLNLDQDADRHFNGSNIHQAKENSSADLFSDFNPQEVLFSDEPETNSTVALPTFKAIYRLP